MSEYVARTRNECTYIGVLAGVRAREAAVDVRGVVAIEGRDHVAIKDLARHGGPLAGVCSDRECCVRV